MERVVVEGQDKSGSVSSSAEHSFVHVVTSVVVVVVDNGVHWHA